jgi:cyclase
MLRKRIIFTLIYNEGFFTQSRNFRLQSVGNLKWLERNYQFQKIAFSLDELIVVDATRGEKSIDKFAKMIGDLVNDVFIPICAGGGINSMKDAEILFNNGADKIIVNRILNKNPSLVRELISNYGSQSVVASIDYKKVDGKNEVYIEDGSFKIDRSLEEYIAFVESLNVGEIYLNSIDKDGTGFGYDFETIEKVSNLISKPLIIAGGAGNENHLIAGLEINQVSAVATANLFNFIGDGLPNARRKIIETGANIANWSSANI